ncbi:serine-type endopeptidase [Aureococcus anophagefferens]|nr:serine-type endopeptidase [Aureococcus anophagefferens]
MNKVLIALALGATRAEVDLNMVKMAADAHEGLLSSRILSLDPRTLGSQDHYEAISLFEAWDVTTGSPDVVVQVLDTGVDMAHPDLKMNIWKNPGEICGNGVDDDNNGYVDDCHGYNHADDTGTDLVSGNWHGSHCGGTIAADNNNGVGVAGVAGGDGSANSGAKLMISVGFGDTAVKGFAEALTYGADMGAQISSNSWGYTGARAASVTSFESLAGKTMVAARPGDAFEQGSPRVDRDSAARATRNRDRPRHPDRGLRLASGTSMACPHVAGVLALGLSVAPDLSKEELLGCLYETARNVDGTNGAYAGKLGAGLVDAEAFVACVGGDAANPRPTPKPTPTPEKPPFGEEQKGFCVTSDGGDQNWGVVKLEGGDFESAAQKAKCLEMCAKVQGVTGCETIWDQWNRGCYAHTRDTLTFDGAVLSAEIKLNWKDQGWGNKKGAVGVSNGDCAGSSCEALAYYHPARATTRSRPSSSTSTSSRSTARASRPRYRVGGGGGHQIYIRDATLTVVVSAEPSPTPAPTPRPTVEPLHPATDVKVKMHGKVGDLAIASWTHATTASQVKFHVEYLTNEADAEWTRVDDGRSYVDEADGRYYQVVAPRTAIPPRG